MSTLNIFLPLTNIFMASINQPFVENHPEIVMSIAKKGTEEVLKVKSKLDFPGKESIFSFEFSVNYGINSKDSLSHLLQLLCEAKMTLKLTRYKMKIFEGESNPECNYIPEVIKLPSVFKPYLEFEISLVHKYYGPNFDALNEGCIYFSIHRDIKGEFFKNLIQLAVKDFRTMLGINSEEELGQFGFRFSIGPDSDSVFETNILSIGTVNTEMFKFIFNEENYSLSVVLVDNNNYYC